MKPLELTLHPKFEIIFGYNGPADRVVFYLDETDKLCYVDGLEQGSANTWAYLLWAAHPSVKPFYHSGMLLLDRRLRKLYSLSREEAIQALSDPKPVDLLIHKQEPKEANPTWNEAQQLMADFVVWLGNQNQRKAA